MTPPRNFLYPVRLEKNQTQPPMIFRNTNNEAIKNPPCFVSHYLNSRESKIVETNNYTSSRLTQSVVLTKILLVDVSFSIWKTKSGSEMTRVRPYKFQKEKLGQETGWPKNPMLSKAMN